MSSSGMREKYQSLALTDLKDIAKSRGIRGTSSMKKADVIEAMLALDEKESQNVESAVPEKKAAVSEKKPAVRKSTQSRKTDAEQAHKAESTQSVKTESAEPARTEAAESRRKEAPEPRAESREMRKTEDRQTEGAPERRNPARIVRNVSAGSAPAARGTERRGVRRFAPGQQAAGQGQNQAHTQGYSQPQNGQHTSGAVYTAGNAQNGSVQNGNAQNGSVQNGIAQNVQNAGSSAAQSEASAVQISAEEGFPAELDSGVSANGILEVMPDGYGFIRCANYLPGENDVYVAPSQIRRFGLKTGDIIVGNTRVKTQNEKFSALLYVKSINGYAPEVAAKRCSFEDMTPIFPEERISLELSRSSVAMRIMDLISPVGKGQRGMIVSPPKAGKTTLLKQVAQSVKTNNPDMHLIILLIDERPEEVTDFREAIEGPNVEVIYSTFDELPEHHKRVSEMVIERAKRLVEHKKDVMILLDSITRLTRAYNLVIPPSGRTLSGGLDPAALHMPKRFFGAARNMREGGSLTILATALVDTGSRMDDVIYEEFKGTGNMEIVLDRKLSERRVFPAIDIPKSSTRREDLLLSPEELEATGILRKALNGLKPEEAVDKILDMFTRTRSNTDFVNVVRKMKIL